jgi:hypothetical protein
MVNPPLTWTMYRREWPAIEFTRGGPAGEPNAYRDVLCFSDCNRLRSYRSSSATAKIRAESICRRALLLDGKNVRRSQLRLRDDGGMSDGIQRRSRRAMRIEPQTDDGIRYTPITAAATSARPAQMPAVCFGAGDLHSCGWAIVIIATLPPLQAIAGRQALWLFFSSLHQAGERTGLGIVVCIGVSPVFA